jgi:hypothetical protein
MYSQETRGSFTSALAQVLNDPTHVYWAQDELDRALNESLLLWGALTGYWTVTGLFSTAANSPFYDLAAQFPVYRARTYTLGDITREIQYHFYEPANGTSGTGMTEQFTIGQILSAQIRRRNEMVLDTRIPLTFTILNAPPQPVDKVALPDDMALITRAAWIDTATGIVSPLRRSDTFAAQSYNPIWNLNPGKPFAYSQAEAMPGSILLLPPPLAKGALHLTYARTISMSTADNQPFLLPDEFVWAVKYGAMYEILSTNSQGYDPLRTKYCYERYTAGLEMAAAHHSVLRVRCKDVPLPLATLGELDSGKPMWQTSRGLPKIAACAYDILAFWRVPDRQYSITCDLSRSAPLPAAPGDYLQVGEEELPYLMDYCRHTLMFKLGGTEFVQSMALYDNFLKGAGQRSRLIGIKARYLTPLFTQPAQEETELPAA